MGDSAGGNLTAVITHRRKLSNKKPSLKGQVDDFCQNYGDSGRSEPETKSSKFKVLIYPLLHMADFQSPSYRYYHKNLEGYALVGEFFSAIYYRIFVTIT